MQKYEVTAEGKIRAVEPPKEVLPPSYYQMKYEGALRRLDNAREIVAVISSGLAIVAPYTSPNAMQVLDKSVELLQFNLGEV